MPEVVLPVSVATLLATLPSVTVPAAVAMTDSVGETMAPVWEIEPPALIDAPVAVTPVITRASVSATSTVPVVAVANSSLTVSSSGSLAAPIEPVVEVSTALKPVMSTAVSLSVIDWAAESVTTPDVVPAVIAPTAMPAVELVSDTLPPALGALTTSAEIRPAAVTDTLPLVDCTRAKSAGTPLPVSPSVMASVSVIVTAPPAVAPSVPTVVRSAALPTALTRAPVAATTPASEPWPTSALLSSVTTPIGAEMSPTDRLLPVPVVVSDTLLSVEVAVTTCIADAALMLTSFRAVAALTVSWAVPRLSTVTVDSGAEAESVCTFVSTSTRPDVLDKVAEAATISGDVVEATASTRLTAASSVTEPFKPASTRCTERLPARFVTETAPLVAKSVCPVPVPVPSVIASLSVIVSAAPSPETPPRTVSTAVRNVTPVRAEMTRFWVVTMPAFVPSIEPESASSVTVAGAVTAA